MKLVRVDDLFEVKYGVNLDLNKLEEVSIGTPNAIPYVGRSGRHNGVTAFVEKINDVIPNPPMTISVAGGGSVMSSFLQEFPYYSGRDLFYLRPKISMSKQLLLYYSTALSMNKFKFSYGRQVNRTLGQLLIPDISEVPADILNYNIDNSTGIKHFKNLSCEVSKVGSDLGKQERSNLKLLKDIFHVYNGVASTNLAVQPEKATENLVPYIRPSKWQSTSYTGYIDKHSVPENKVFPEGTLYVSTNGAGSHTYSYVSIEPFVPNSDVTVLIPKEELSLEKKLAYATLITANRFKFSYGRKPKGDRLKSILLPVL